MILIKKALWLPERAYLSTFPSLNCHPLRARSIPALQATSNTSRTDHRNLQAFWISNPRFPRWWTTSDWLSQISPPLTTYLKESPWRMTPRPCDSTAVRCKKMHRCRMRMSLLWQHGQSRVHSISSQRSNWAASNRHSSRSLEIRRIWYSRTTWTSFHTHPGPISRHIWRKRTKVAWWRLYQNNKASAASPWSRASSKTLIPPKITRSSQVHKPSSLSVCMVAQLACSCRVQLIKLHSARFVDQISVQIDTDYSSITKEIILIKIIIMILSFTH